MKKIAVLILLCICFVPIAKNESVVMADSDYVTVIATSCYLYETGSFDTVLKVDESPVECRHGEKLAVVENNVNSSFIKVSITISETSFLGYIYRYYVTFNDVEQYTYPVFNGKVKKDKAIIYDLDKNETLFEAKSGQGVYLYQGFSNKEEFTAVAIVLQDGSLYYGFMKTYDISPNGVNAGLITGIVVIISCLTIIFLLLFMKKVKNKK